MVFAKGMSLSEALIRLALALTTFMVTTATASTYTATTVPFELRNRHGICVGLTDLYPGGKIRMRKCDGSKSQKWIFDASSKTGSSFQSMAKMNMCVHTGQFTQGTQLYVSSCMTPRPRSQLYRYFAADFDPTKRDANGARVLNANGQVVGGSGLCWETAGAATDGATLYLNM